MKRIALTLSLAGFFSALAYYVWTHPDRDRLTRLRKEHAHLKRQNDQLAEKNDKLRQKIVAMRKNPRLAERQARARGGLARPDELVIQFDDIRREKRELQVELRVESKAVVLAGERLAIEELEGELARMHERLPAAELTVAFGSGVGPLRKERIIKVVDASNLAPARYRNDD